MKIKEIFKSKKPVVALEVFPPKADVPIETVFDSLEQFEALKPDYISVTYGAGGSTAGRTLEIADKIKNHYHIEALAHLTCVGCTTKDMEAILDRLKSCSIENVLALRGDPPQGEKSFVHMSGGYMHAEDLVKHIKDQYGFCTGAAAHPEGHPESVDFEESLHYLKCKVDSGVDFLVTQLFFDNAIFYKFLDKVHQLDIKCPIKVGVMPVLNASQVKRMTTLCGASIPVNLSKLMYKYADSPADMEKAGIEYACEQIIDLVNHNVDGIHLYTMNKAEQSKTILQQTGLR
jgi:methylenetetrahydrofolate reductase (NADPH)